MMCRFILSPRPDWKTVWHTGHIGFSLFSSCSLDLCRRRESFHDEPVNFARHPLYGHFSTIEDDLAPDVDGEGAGAGEVINSMLPVASRRLSNVVSGAGFEKELWSIPSGWIWCSTSMGCWAERTPRSMVLSIMVETPDRPCVDG